MTIRNLLVLGFLAGALAAAEYPAPQEGDWTARNFQFVTRETLAELKLHYTIGKPERDASGIVRMRF